MSPSRPVIDQFEEHRPRLASIAYRMLGSRSDADDAMQETWLRVARADITGIASVGSWFTTITARVCLNMLRSRHTRREDPFDIVVPDPVIREANAPEDEALLADSVSIALLIVLETLDPAERLAFVLHDMFAVPFDEIAALVERTPAATRQLASRARRRIQTNPPVSHRAHAGEHRRLVDAFFAAARDGDLDTLLAVLAPDLILRTEGGVTRSDATGTTHGAHQVARRALRFASPNAHLRPVLINDKVGVLTTITGQRVSLMAFTIEDGLITRIDALVDPARLTLVAAAVDQ